MCASSRPEVDDSSCREARRPCFVERALYPHGATFSDMSVLIKPLEAGDIERLAADLPVFDRLEVCAFQNCADEPEEILSVLRKNADEADYNFSAFVDGELCACFGVGECGRYSALSATRGMWMLRTHAMLRHKKVFLRHIREVVESVLRRAEVDGIVRLEILAWDKHVEARRLLERFLKAPRIGAMLLASGEVAGVYELK